VVTALTRPSQGSHGLSRILSVRVGFIYIKLTHKLALRACTGVNMGWLRLSQGPRKALTKLSRILRVRVGFIYKAYTQACTLGLY